MKAVPMNIATKANDVRFITKKVFHESDTTTIRLILATASIGWTIVLLWNLAIGVDIMGRQAYTVMRVIGREWTWAILFAIHFFAVVWRLYDPIARPRWSLLVNGFGFAIWTVSTVAIGISIGFVPPSTALEITMCVASGWAFYRTDLRKEMVTP